MNESDSDYHQVIEKYIDNFSSYLSSFPKKIYNNNELKYSLR